MKNVFKQIFSFILPVTVLDIIPLLIEKDIKIHVGNNLFAGLVFMLSGLIIMSVTIASFIQIGKGTLAPWSPTKKLVITGLYRYVRNPMILGVLIVLLGEAITLWSCKILIWAGSVFIINTIYFIMYEEPDLENKFGEEYRQYKRNVSRWLPRLTPFHEDKNEQV